MIIAIAIGIVFYCVLVPPLRRNLFTRFIYKLAAKSASKISPLEQQALESGTAGFDAEFFKGKPNWEKLHAIPSVKLSAEEQQFIDGPVAQLCALIDDWDIRGVRKDIPEPIWDFMKANNFFGLRVSKELGGLGFSTQAQSIIFGIVASRSYDVSILISVSNSLGPDELIEQYGTDEQKDKYLKQFREGTEIPCFAITSAIGGSDVGSMRDVGRVTRGMYEGKEIIGISLTWSKRYITLAPKATVVSLAVKVIDPDLLLGSTTDRGITLLLIPAKYPGVNIGRRHLPSAAAFPNGPTSGTDVFVPLSFVLGGEQQIGNGWKLIMQCLAAGRGISLPSISAAGVKMMLRTSSAYARVRRQFGRPIGYMEGVQEPLVRLIESAYSTEAARAVTAAIVSATERPLVIASIMKQRLTEAARSAVLDAMDIHAGKGIIDGPSNYLQSAYQVAPIGITVEGANILTRSLMIMGQAVLRSHPYFARELKALSDTNYARGLTAFDAALTQHVWSLFKNGVFAFLHNVTSGAFASTAHKRGVLGRWYKQVSRASRTFAFVADFVVVYYQGGLKKRQRISGRVADALSELYFMSCALKRFEDEGARHEDEYLLELVLTNGMHRFDQAIHAIKANVPNIFLRWLLTLITISPITRRPASDTLCSKVARQVLEPGDLRNCLTRYTYVPAQKHEPIALLEQAFTDVVQHDAILNTYDALLYSKQLTLQEGGYYADAVQKKLLTSAEAATLMDLEVLVNKVLTVDDFSPEEV